MPSMQTNYAIWTFPNKRLTLPNIYKFSFIFYSIYLLLQIKLQGATLNDYYYFIKNIDTLLLLLKFYIYSYYFLPFANLYKHW